MADHERLDRAIETRAVDLGLSYIQLAERAGISDVSLRNFRKGRGNLKPLNRRKLETALEWAPGSIGLVLEGEHPIELGGEAPADGQLTAQDLRRLIAETQDELRHLAPKYESNRPSLAAHLERRIADLQRQLDALNNSH